MFYNMITRKRDKWFSSQHCTVNELISYIVTTGQMRDAQIEAIKTYLFLKIACNNRPLWELFSEGAFNTVDVDSIELSTKTRNSLASNPAALALFEYSMLTNDKKEQVSSKLEELIKVDTDNIDYVQVFKDIFNEITYTDYLFSLPMGAGKTYLMAAFIYLDLYFAQNEPDNNAFAHNFIVFAPSGLKSSVVPSLKTIQKFEPSWVIPEPAASDLKRLVKFEVLDQPKTTKKSNKTKNPNVQKIAIHQPLDELMGLIAVTNAEKVIMDRVVIKGGQINFFEESDDEKDRQANELRNLIGKLPNLAIYIDEVHHAVDDDIKLRSVVNNWAKNKTINSVIGFSGTPYLQNAEVIQAADNFSFKNLEISNVVYYYPLINGINNFLKNPIVHISNKQDSIDIVESGVRNFLDNYKDKTYNNGLIAKLGIYCGKIETLEEVIYPRIVDIIREYGFDPNEVILKYHKGNKTYKLPQENETEFASLDTPVSKKKIILLVQVGKEGWDCRSLTGVILSQKGDCPTNMVLQTACRCLRQVDKDSYETAVIWLNEFNSEKLNAQLQQQQHISIDEFTKKTETKKTEILRYSRMKHLKLPSVNFYQLKVQYKTSVDIEALNTSSDILNSITSNAKTESITKIQKFDGQVINISVDQEYGHEPITFSQWLHEISKESFGFISIQTLNKYLKELGVVFESITYIDDDICYYSSRFNQDIIKSNIRKAFYGKRSFITHEEVIPANAELLRVDNLISPYNALDPENFYPDQSEVTKIIKADSGKITLDEKTLKAIKSLEEIGQHSMAEDLRKVKSALPERDKTYHYLPYHFDSNFEIEFLKEIVNYNEFKDRNLEIYYNGDRSLTDFKIKCFKDENGRKKYIGQYTPDFLILSRKSNKIHKLIIVETKGAVYSNDRDFNDKKSFMENIFIKLNSEKFGYNRFQYLYLEDSLTESERILKTTSAIVNFFKEEN